MKAMLVECTDYDTVYGILTVENVSAQEVQHQIYEIKKRFHNEGNDCWSIDDVLEQLPEEWDWDFERGIRLVEI